MRTVYIAPVIATSGAPNSLTATYGTASASSNFSVSGNNMQSSILIAPPAGFEVSTNSSVFSPTVSVGNAGNIPSTIIYIRLSASTTVNNYSGNIILSSQGATDQTFNMPNSTVVPAALTITATDAIKTYGQTLTAGPGSTAFTATGLRNNETIGTVTTGYGPGSAATDGVGDYSGCVTVADAAGGTFNPANYDITWGDK